MSYDHATCSAHPIQHSVTHHITTTGPPVTARTRRLSPERLAIARQEFDHMLELGIVRPSSSNCMGIATAYGPKEDPRGLAPMR